MGVAEDEFASPEATGGLSPPMSELDEVVAGGNEAGRGAGGRLEGLVSAPLSDSFPDVEVASGTLAPAGG